MKQQKLLPILILAVSFFILDKLQVIQPVKNVLLTVLKPFQAPLYAIERNTGASFQILTQISKLNEVNRNLSLENAALKAENEKLKKYEAENKLLSDQLNIGRYENELVKVENYGFDTETKELIVKLNGEVAVNQSVVIGNNFIGKIVKIEASFAKVRLPSDPEAKIPVVTSGGVRGISSGRYRSEIVIEKLLVDEKIAEKELIMTTGESGYLKGLVVGQVTSIKSSEKDLFKEVTVKPLVDPKNTSVFFVIKN